MRTSHRVPRRYRARTLAAVAALFAVLVVAPSPATGQTYWRVPAALGGALVGAGAGWALDIARWAGSDDLGPSLAVTPVGLAIGGLVGFGAGLSADRRLARGDTLRRGTRAMLRVATFLAPVAIGSAAAFAIINPSDERCVPAPDPSLGCTYQPVRKALSDETVAVLGIGGGIVVGFVAQYRFAPALWPKARVGLAPDGRGVVVSIPAGW